MKKPTVKEEVKALESHLQKDEGAWLKSLGELGDLARLILKLQEDQIRHEKEIVHLRERIKNHEEGKT